MGIRDRLKNEPPPCLRCGRPTPRIPDDSPLFHFWCEDCAEQRVRRRWAMGAAFFLAAGMVLLALAGCCYRCTQVQNPGPCRDFPPRRVNMPLPSVETGGAR